MSIWEGAKRLSRRTTDTPFRGRRFVVRELPIEKGWDRAWHREGGRQASRWKAL